MTIINNQGARVLTRDELLNRLQATIRPKVRRDRFQKLRDAALATAERVIPVQFNLNPR